METRGGHHTHGDFLKMWSHRGWRELEGSFRAEDVTFDILCESSVCHPPSRLGWPPVGEGEQVAVSTASALERVVGR